MKKSLFLILIFVSFISCTVNDTTGLLVITNLSNSDVTNIKVGGTTLSTYLSSGSKLDYWYFTPLTGQISAKGVANKYDVTFKQNYEYQIEIFEKDSHNYFKINQGRGKGTDIDDDSNFDEPVD